MKKFWLKILIFTFLIGAVIWAGKGIFKYSVFSTHDGDHHLARVYDVIQTIKEGQFPLRWAGSLNYFCGVPIYNFYYPFIYYVAAGVNLFTNNPVLTLKIIEFLAMLVGTIFFYAWIKTETKKDLAAIGGALTYLYAPYRFLLIFVRASPEYLAYAILPIVLYFYSLFFNSKGKKSIFYIFVASVLGTILTISHNFTVMFLMPIILAYLVIKVIVEKVDIKKILWLAFSFVASFGMGSFFIGPALMEQKFTKIGMGFLEWRDHFPTLGQLFKSKWNYFYSAPGTVNDGMSFMLGYAQWLILGIAAIFLLYQILKNKFNIKKFFVDNIYVLFFLLISLVAIYLILPISIPVWEKIKLLQEIQFSWRILGIAVFGISALFSFLLAKLNSKVVYVGIFIGVSLLSIVGTRNFMLPQPIADINLYAYDNFEKLHPERYSTTTLADEVTTPTAPGSCWFSTEIVSTNKEKISYKIVERGNTYGSVKFEIPKKLQGNNLIMGLSYFPGNYKFILNGMKSEYSDCAGQVCFPISKLRGGENLISWRVGQSPIESLFNYIALGFFILWIVVLIIFLTGIHKDKKRLTYFVLTLPIFGIFIFFRAYNLNSRIIFGWDQERDALAAINILAGKFTLLGPRIQGPMGFFLPPYFFYLLAPFYALSNHSPVAISSFIIFSATVFFVTSYFVISKIFNNATGGGKYIALLFLALWAVNPLAISIDTISWNPVVVPTLLMIFVYFYFLCLKQINKAILFFSGLIFGLGMSFHTQFVFALLLFIPVLIDIFKSKKFNLFICFIIGAAIPFLPILFFDIRHNFLNLHQLLNYSLNSSVVENRTLVVWGNVISFVTGFSSTKLLGLSFYILMSVILVVLISKTKDIVNKKLFAGLSYVWIFSLPIFCLILKNPSEYYFNYLLVILFLITAYLASLKKIFGIIIIIILVICFASRSLPLLKNTQYNLQQKTDSVVFLKNITQNTNPFNISFDVPANEDSGFRYLLQYYKVNYSGNSKDSLIEFVVPVIKKPTAFNVGGIGIYVPGK